MTHCKSLFFCRPGRQLCVDLIRRCVILFFCTLNILLVSCIFIPTPEHGLLDGRGEIDDSDILFLEEGKTTREEVLLRFGEPDLILNDQRTIVYHWQVNHGYWFVGGGYSGTGGPIPKDYLFMLEFDEEGRLKSFEKSGSIWKGIPSYLNPGTPSNAPKYNEIIVIDPRPEVITQPSIPAEQNQSICFSFGELQDQRSIGNNDSIIGYKKALGYIFAEVHSNLPVIDILRVAISSQLESEGHCMAVQDADIILTVEIVEFGVTTPLSLTTWDVIGSLNVIVTVKSLLSANESVIRRYKAKHTSKTILGPEKDDFEQVMHECLEDMMLQFSSDSELASLLSGNWLRSYSSD